MMSLEQVRRVVVTGIGLVTPLGVGVQSVWDSLIGGVRAGDSLAGTPGFEQIPSKVCCRVPEGKAAGQLDLVGLFTAADRRTMSRSSMLAIVAAGEAMGDAGLVEQSMVKDTIDTDRFGVAIGSSIMDVEDIHAAGKAMDTGQYRKISPYFIPRVLTSMPGGLLSMRYGLRGPNQSVAAACATGSMSIGDAATMIRLGRADLMLAGATDACISPIVMAGFGRLKALSTAFNDDPTAASRPFDAKRDGFVMGEGAGILVLETLEHALGRQAPVIYGEILGYGLSGDASHMTSPDATGRGARSCMSNALKDASLSIDSVGYINTHGTSTPVGDQIEADAIATLLNLSGSTEVLGGPQTAVCISSTKGSTGHLQGAAGAVEAIFAILAAQTATVPPTGNLTDCDFAGTSCRYSRMDFIAGEAVPWPVNLSDSLSSRIAMSNSFGFGGLNASLVFGSYDSG